MTLPNSAQGTVTDATEDQVKTAWKMMGGCVTKSHEASGDVGSSCNDRMRKEYMGVTEASSSQGGRYASTTSQQPAP